MGYLHSLSGPNQTYPFLNCYPKTLNYKL